MLAGQAGIWRAIWKALHERAASKMRRVQVYMAITNALLMQASSVCKRLSQAAVHCLESRPALSFYFWEIGCAAPNMSSKLLLHFAPLAKHVFLDMLCAGWHGIRDFMAATQLREASVNFPGDYHNDIIGDGYTTMYCSQQFDRQACRDFASWAEDLEELECDARMGVLQAKAPAVSEQLDLMLHSLSGLQFLHKLTINMGSDRVLNSRVFLQEVPELHLSFERRMGSGQMDLSWLFQQSHGQLHLEVQHLGLYNTSNALLDHHTTVRDLRELRITTLQLDVWSTIFDRTAQQVWAQLSVQDKVHLSFIGHGGADILHSLPRCQLVKIAGRGPCMWPPPQLLFSGSALTQPGRLHVCMSEDQELVVDGFTSLPDSSGDPWQLVVHAAAGVQGLPPSRPTSEVWYLQNAAADAAGWQGKLLEDCKSCCPCRKDDGVDSE